MIRLLFLSNGNVVCVSHADQVQQSSNNNVFGAIIGGCVRDGGLPPIHGAAEDVKAARTNVADETQNSRISPPLGAYTCPSISRPRINIDLMEAISKQATNPAFLNQVSRARNQPANCRCDHRNAVTGSRLSVAAFVLTEDVFAIQIDHNLTLNFTGYFRRF